MHRTELVDLKKMDSQITIMKQSKKHEIALVLQQQEAIQKYVEGLQLWKEGIEYQEIGTPASLTKALTIFNQLLPMYVALNQRYHGTAGLVHPDLLRQRSQQQYFTGEIARIEQIKNHLKQEIKPKSALSITPQPRYIIHDQGVTFGPTSPRDPFSTEFSAIESQLPVSPVPLLSPIPPAGSFSSLTQLHIPDPLGHTNKRQKTGSSSSNDNDFSGMKTLPESPLPSSASHDSKRKAKKCTNRKQKKKTLPSNEFTLPEGGDAKDFESIAAKLQELDNRGQSKKDKATKEMEAAKKIAREAAELAISILAKVNPNPKGPYRPAVRLILSTIGYRPLQDSNKSGDLSLRIKSTFLNKSKQDFHQIIAFRNVRTLQPATIVIINILTELRKPEIDKEVKKKITKQIEKLLEYKGLLEHMKETEQEFIYGGVGGSYKGTYRSINLEKDCYNRKIKYKLRKDDESEDNKSSSAPIPVLPMQQPASSAAFLSSTQNQNFPEQKSQTSIWRNAPRPPVNLPISHPPRSSSSHIPTVSGNPYSLLVGNQSSPTPGSIPAHYWRDFSTGKR